MDEACEFFNEKLVKILDNYIDYFYALNFCPEQYKCSFEDRAHQ